METNDLLDRFIAAALENLTSLPQWLQFVILCIATLITIAAHIAPYTPTAKDDFLSGRSGKLLEIVRKIFNLVAGNYRNAANHDDVIAEKAKIKDSKK